ncbi:MAG TPA: hypothetical protein PKM50_01710 [Methanoregula sp.]|nr:hypothetical protein [Methanoregula sp.]
MAVCIPGVTAVTLTTGSSTTTTISQGDPVYIRGIATGHPQAGLQVWFIGYNFAKVTTVQVNDDNSYEYKLSESDTRNLATGQYFVLIQHPMMNGQFDVVYDAGSGTVKEVQSGKILYRFTGSGKLQSTDAAKALMQAVGSQNIDDTFASVSFYVSHPTVAFNQIGDKYPGDKFTITGTTNLAAGDNLMVDIYSSSFAPTSKTQSSGFSGVSGMVKVVSGSGGMNSWSFDVDTTSFIPDEYIVKVSAVEQDMTATSRFNVLQPCGGSNGTCSVPTIEEVITTVPAVTTVITTVPETLTEAPTSVPETTPSAPLPVAVCFVSIAAALLIRRIV